MSDARILDELFATVESRKGADPSESWTAKLFAKGTGKIAQKVGEEAVETVIEAMKGDREALTAESADLLFHLLVLWADQDIRPDDVWAALEKRRGTSGISEKASRTDS
ncbi:phosphoribosyl-ATP diphosphatase [Kiloniella sp. b19]|uniref:phosphoribosyl-ATP diphosphatase n=1 Tax=Kiloniella sp. GXU_MW_B19 TaxID=3141326 RepID=UPI0031D7C1FF